VQSFCYKIQSDFDINNLPTAIESVGWIDAVWTKERAVSWIDSELRCAELIGSAAFAGALLRLFAFWLTHGSSPDWINSI
jgi:hypothetical protein